MCPSAHSKPSGSVPIGRPESPRISGNAFLSHSCTSDHSNLSEAAGPLAANVHNLLGLELLRIGAWITYDSVVGLGTDNYDRGVNLCLSDAPC
jgi:hypothetical protein